MTTDGLERRYRRLMRAYPAAYRQERGDELLGTLMELSRPGQRRPSAREARALVLGGLRVRAGADRLRSTMDSWLDAARVALVLILAVQILLALRRVDGAWSEQPPIHPMPVTAVAAAQALLAGAAIAALARVRYRLAMVLALLAPVPSFVDAAAHTWDNTVPVATVLWWLPVIGLLVPLLRHRPPAGPWRWQLSLPLFLVLVALVLPRFGLLLTSLVVVLLGIAACLAWAVLVDPRPAIAFGLLLLASMAQVLIYVAIVLILAPMLVAGLALLATGAVRAQRHVRA